MRRLNWKMLSVGLALSTALIHPLAVARAQAQVAPTVQQEQAVDVSELRSHLTAQNWAAADAETRRILDRWIHPGSDILSTPQAANIPPEVLRTLDQLWVEASSGRFGFSVQQRIWADISAQHPPDANIVAKVFGDRVGWTRPSGMEDPTFIAGEWLTEREINPALDTPVGHLPWAGVSWEQIDRILSAQSCGSCTIDAMYVQGERFNQYLPLLYNRVETALDLTVPRCRR